MKKWIPCIIGVFICGGFTVVPPFEKLMLENFSRRLQVVPQEKLYLHTDKSVYNMGETLWFRGYLVESLRHTPVVLSRFIYADLVGRSDSLVARVKVVRYDTTFSGHIKLPESLPQGDYELRGYTQYMQNVGEEHLFRKKIRVINPRESQVKSSVTYERHPSGDYVAKIRLKDLWDKPYAREILRYTTNLTKPFVSPRVVRADNSGEVEIRINREVKYLDLSFSEEAQIPLNRRIHIPDLWNEFDIQFFPEGGSLLAGNWQTVAFKAIGTNGMGTAVSGELYQDSVVIGTFSSEHDGMGSVNIPVSPGCAYSVVTRLDTGEEMRVELPQPSLTGFGLAIERNDSVLVYRVMKGVDAVFPEELYLLAHCRGTVLLVQPVERVFRGKIPTADFPEGIVHFSLVDRQGQVYSQRLVFIKKQERPEILVRQEKPAYVSREKVSLHLSLRGCDDAFCNGSFSVSVTDDTQVPVDSLEDNIHSNLLLVSDLKGYLHEPAYYFLDDRPERNRHLDLVMMTHGWTRFDLSGVIRGDISKNPYPLEIGQAISGRVKNFWGKSAPGANIILLSTTGIFQMVETDETGYFEIDGFTFPDSTHFLVQALSAKGRKRVEVSVDRDAFLPVRYRLPFTLEAQQKEAAFFDLYGKDYYYENGEKIYILNEVAVVGRKRPKSYSFYDNVAYRNLDSTEIANSGFSDLFQLIQMMIPGVILETNSDGDESFSYFSRPLHVLANDFDEDMVYLRTIDVRAVRSISMLDAIQTQMFFGKRDFGGTLIISYEFGYVSPRRQPLHIKPFTLLGYQKPEAFYMPRYDVDSVRRDARYDSRSTIYWKPVQPISSGKEHTLTFFTADMPGRYTVTIEGVTGEGVVCRKRYPLTVR